MKKCGRKIGGDKAYQTIDLPQESAKESKGRSHTQETYKNGVKPVHVLRTLLHLGLIYFFRPVIIMEKRHNKKA